MKNLSLLVEILQTQLRAEMSQAGVSYEDAAQPLGYANKSSIARLLAKDRMSMEDTIKLMILCKTESIELTKPFKFKIEVKASTMAQADALMDALRVSVFKEGTTERYRLPDGLTWEKVAEHTGFESGKSARKSWFLLQTPVYLVVGLLRLLGKGKHEVSEGKTSLRITPKVGARKKQRF
ncbi:MAG: hypothetical protein R3D58_07175 [Saprospiraceae bacterium]|nr:hypothetical protein [Lewinellaceae bacterium]